MLCALCINLQAKYKALVGKSKLESGDKFSHRYCSYLRSFARKKLHLNYINLFSILRKSRLCCVIC